MKHVKEDASKSGAKPGADGDINVMNYADRSPVTVYKHTKVARAFEMFRKLGMRHLCVVDNTLRIAGMLTRKDLMAHRLSDAIREKKVHSTIRGWITRHRAAQGRDVFDGHKLSEAELTQRRQRKPTQGGTSAPAPSAAPTSQP